MIHHAFHRGGRPIVTMAKSWRTSCKKAGVRARLMHDLRRTAGTSSALGFPARWP
jgi:hypothetical protein